MAQCEPGFWAVALTDTVLACGANASRCGFGLGLGGGHLKTRPKILSLRGLAGGAFSTCNYVVSDYYYMYESLVVLLCCFTLPTLHRFQCLVALLLLIYFAPRVRCCRTRVLGGRRLWVTFNVVHIYGEHYTYMPRPSWGIGGHVVEKAFKNICLVVLFVLVGTHLFVFVFLLLFFLFLLLPQRAPSSRETYDSRIGPERLRIQSPSDRSPTSRTE